MKYVMSDGDHRDPEELFDDDLVDELCHSSWLNGNHEKTLSLKQELKKRLSGELKLFVWEGVLCDYSCGVMFALAPDVDTARKMLIEKLSKWNIGELNTEPTIYTVPFALAVYGGS